MLRSNTQPRLRLVAAGLAVCGGLAIAAPALGASAAPAARLAASSSPAASAAFVVGNTDAVDTLNPFTGFTTEDFEVYGLIYDNLMDYGQLDYSGTPRLATSWSHSKDGLTWTYHIRKGVKWSDGVPLTAADVAYTFQRDIKPNSTEFADNEAYVRDITKAVATGKYTVVMKVKHYTPVMTRLIVPILPEHIWKHISEKQLGSFKNLHPVGSGPFTVSSFSPDQTIRLTANTHYWGGKPGIKTLVFQRFNDPAAEKAALAHGTIDFAEGLTPGLWKSLKRTPGVKLINAPAGNFDELAFNNGAATVTGQPIGNGNLALRDVNVRHAISYALNVPVLVKKVLLNTGEVGTSIIPPVYTQFHYSPPRAERYHYDPAKARAILDAAGWKVGADGIRVKKGKQLALRLFVRKQSPAQTRDAPYIKGWLNAIGIKVTVTSMSDSQLTADIGNGQYDMFLWGWSVEPNPDFQLSVFTCGQRSYGNGPTYSPGWSDSFYCSHSYDKLYHDQQRLAGAARAKVVKQMQQMLYDADAYNVLYYVNDIQAYRSDRFTGFAPSPDEPNGLYLFQEVQWWSYRCLRPVGSSPSLTDHNIGCQHETGTMTAPASSSVNAGMIGGIAGAVVVVAAGIWLFSRRRRAATAGERE